MLIEVVVSYDGRTLENWLYSFYSERKARKAKPLAEMKMTKK